MLVSWLPTALCRRTATTDESTPPLSPQITFSRPICSFRNWTVLITKDSMVQSGGHWQMRKRKLCRISFPRGVWTTSGWNCTP